jgi:hypothetical protein
MVLVSLDPEIIKNMSSQHEHASQFVGPNFGVLAQPEKEIHQHSALYIGRCISASYHKALLNALPAPSEAPRPGVLTLESKRQLLLQGQLDLLNYAISHSYTFSRWKKVATLMIRKDSDSKKVHRLRVIHLYEADLNLLLGVKWRSLIHHCTDHSLLNSGQFGGLPVRDAMTPILLEELQWETSRASRRSHLRMDFDASSCYDRIIPSIASLAARSYGQHQALCLIHGTFLQQAKYVLQKTWPIGRAIFPLPPASDFCTGQGSANSPAKWALIFIARSMPRPLDLTAPPSFARTADFSFRYS